MMLPISIIIPAKNEEKYLPRLLTSIKNQTMTPKEIIVADGKSTDKTVEIARSYGCLLTDGGKLPGIARNNGAKLAKEEALLFLDADAKLPLDFLEKNYHEFIKRKLGCASCFTTPSSGKIIDTIGAWMLDTYFLLTQRWIQNAYGFCLFVKKSVHEQIHGFDEKILIAEDWDYATRANKIAPYRFLTSRKIIVSVRRFDKEGRFTMVIRYLRVFAYTTFIGKITHQLVHYKFDQFSDSHPEE